MSSSIFGAEDPWENGWVGEGNDNGPSTLPSFGTDSQLTSSQLLSNNTQFTSNDDQDESRDSKGIPKSYSRVKGSILSKLATANDFEYLVVRKVVDKGYLTDYQSRKIFDVLQDHDIFHQRDADSLYKALGLIALEIESPGSGDFVTLQFRLSNLPPLPNSLVQSIEDGANEDSVDPLSEELQKTSIYEPDLNASSSLSNPLLSTHSSLQHAEVEDDSSSPLDSTEVKDYIDEIRSYFKPILDSSNIITIKEVPEKEGLLFKHINYVITHDLKFGPSSHSGTKKVIRRFADFVWLLEFLLKKYPFRIVPGLPPKKFNGASLDSQFLQRRRRGLHRFLNQLIKHPVLVKEPVVITFLTVPTDLATWRKQAKVDYSLEFKGMKISTHFINSIWPVIGNEFLNDWAKAEKYLPKLIDTWTKIVLLVERHEKRQHQAALDNAKFVEMVGGFKLLNPSIYPNNESTTLGNSNKYDLGTINDSLDSVTEYFNGSSRALIDESYWVNTSILEKFKNYLDYLYSFQDLIERAKALSINNIDQLHRKINDNESKYNTLNNESAEIKGRDLVKLRQIIINDKQDLFQSLNKDWLIKKSCFDEFIIIQETQYLLSEIWIGWLKNKTKFAEKYRDLNENLSTTLINDMPLPK